jgi:pyroglutamyl-peptidase
VHALELPSRFGQSIDALVEAIDRIEPQLVIALGQAGSRAMVSVERVAVNIEDARIPDNAGEQPVDRPVIETAPAAYFATLPIKAIVAELRAAGIPAAVSQTAGTFVCNHVFFGLMHHIATRRPSLRGGFIHLPLLPSQAAAAAHAGAASMSLETMVQAVRIALVTSLTEHVDRPIGCGVLD